MAFPILGLIAGAQAIYGAIKSNNATNDFNATMKDRKPIKTPDELYKVLQATEANAQGGFDAATLQYLTSNNDRAFSSSLGTLLKMGGDPNSAASLFDQQVQSIMKVGAQNHALNLENFSKYLGGLETIANAKVAEQVSQQDIVKDRLQAANANKQAAFANIQSGINTGITAATLSEYNKMYGVNNNNLNANSFQTIDAGNTVSPYSTAYQSVDPSFRPLVPSVSTGQVSNYVSQNSMNAKYPITTWPQ